jgi:hypothetical protein
MARIKWTPNERALVTNTLVSYLKANGLTADEVMKPGWIMFYLQQAQQFLPAERKRRITNLQVIPWFIPSLYAGMGMQQPKPVQQQVQDIPAFVRANMVAVLAELSKTHIIVEKTECVQRQIHKPKPVNRGRQLRVLVAGVLPAQAASLSATYGKLLDLRFWYSSESAGSGGTLPSVDYVVGVTAFISHSLDGKLRQQFKARYQRIVGAVTAVDHVLAEILETGKERVAA